MPGGLKHDGFSDSTSPLPRAKPRDMTDASLAARGAALDLLETVLRKKIPLDDAFDAHEGLDALEPRDRGFVRPMVATVLRRLGQIDALITETLTKPDPVRAGVLDILRLGVASSSSSTLPPMPPSIPLSPSRSSAGFSIIRG